MNIICRIMLLFLTGINTLHAQTNLVVNGNFEEYTTCPADFVKFGKQNTSVGWTSPHHGTPDYFNKCSKLAGVPENFAGLRSAYAGNGYGGIVATVHASKYKEYLQAPLSHPLEAGKKYVVTFYACWAQNSSYMISELGVLFTDTSLHSAGTGSYMKADITFKVHNYRDWERLTDTILARGNEKYIMIGNFQPYEQIRYIKHEYAQNSPQNPLYQSAYYYLDLVIVKELKDPAVPDFPVGESFVGEGIYFELDKYELSDSSASYLNEVVAFMENNPELKIKIEGHTDRHGTAEYNYTLSEKRAEGVQQYLMSHGIDEERISIKGWGYDKPVTNEEHLQYLNRRIELNFQ